MDDFTPDSAQQIHDLKLKYGMKIEPTEDDSPETQVDFFDTLVQYFRIYLNQR